nr:immunoglobulin light chain junction region [Macaca mulatta]
DYYCAFGHSGGVLF